MSAERLETPNSSGGGTVNSFCSRFVPPVSSPGMAVGRIGRWLAGGAVVGGAAAQDQAGDGGFAG
jgi:hypothetical protein